MCSTTHARLRAAPQQTRREVLTPGEARRGNYARRLCRRVIWIIWRKRSRRGCVSIICGSWWIALTARRRSSRPRSSNVSAHRCARWDNAPDGRNINQDCGSLYVERLRDRVLAENAGLGVAFDGDADRALFVDARGEVVDGDATLWVMAKSLQSRGELAGGRIVATVMSNIGSGTRASHARHRNAA